MGLLFFSFDSTAKSSSIKSSDTISLLKNTKNLVDNDLFFSQNKNLALETPDLKIIQDSFIYGISTPRLLTAQTLGDIFGGNNQERKEIIDYIVQPGDTIKSLSEKFDISENTIAWANDISKNSALKVDQNLTILPISGLVYTVKSGDTISQISIIYKAKVDDIVADNGLANEGDIFIGDTLLVRGVMPQKAIPIVVNTSLADNFFIYPASGRISQGLHFYNAIDIANKCGTPIYAAASGVVQRVKYGYNFGGGNNATILHSGGIVTYYGHLMTIFVKPGDKVNVGDRIALVGGGTGTAGDGLSTGCHLHFGVTGAKNPLAKYYVGTMIDLK